MTEKDMAVEVGKQLIGRQEHIDALKAALRSKYHWTDQQMKELDLMAFDLESQARREAPSPSPTGQVLKAIEDATEDIALVPLLYQITQTTQV